MSVVDKMIFFLSLVCPKYSICMKMSGFKLLWKTWHEKLWLSDEKRRRANEMECIQGDNRGICARCNTALMFGEMSNYSLMKSYFLTALEMYTISHLKVCESESSPPPEREQMLIAQIAKQGLKTFRAFLWFILPWTPLVYRMGEMWLLFFHTILFLFLCDIVDVCQLDKLGPFLCDKRHLYVAIIHLKCWPWISQALKIGVPALLI